MLDGGRCLEVRTTDEGFKRRRYVLPSGERVSTIEIPLEVWQGINRAGRSKDRASAWRRARSRESLRAMVTPDLLAGVKLLALSAEHGVSIRTLTRWKRAAQEGRE